MLAKVSTFLGPNSFFKKGGTPSLSLSLDAFGYMGSGTWSDLSTFNNDSTAVGSITYSDEVGGSFDFDGVTGKFIFPNVSGIPLGNSPYTIEVWFKSDSYGPSEQGSLVSWGGLYAQGYSNVLRLNGNGIYNYWWDNDINVVFTGTQSLIVDNWYHVAATYDGSVRKLYLNGNQVAQDTPINNLLVNDQSTLKIGYDGLNYFNGKISKVKIYSRSLPSSRLLSNFNNDKIRHGYIFGSMLYGGTSSYFISSSDDYILGTDDYTLETYFNCATYSNFSGILSMRDYSEQGLAINMTNNGLLRFMIQGSYRDSITISTNRWYHVAISRVGGTTSCYINGIYDWEFTDTNNYLSQDIVGGRYYTNHNDFYFNGIISNVRLTSGLGLYSGTSSFSIPNTPLSPMNETELLIISQKTSLASDTSGNLHSVIKNNIGWTSSIPSFVTILLNFIDFSSTAGLELIDTHDLVNNSIYLTDAASAGDAGNIYTSQTSQFNKNFSIEWNFECSGGSGADGFTIQWTTTNDGLGGSGGMCGLISDPSTINAFQFQTYTNNVINWYKNDILESSSSVSPETFRQNVFYWMDYDHINSIIDIYHSLTNIKPVSPQHTFNSVIFDTGSYYFGIGAACGGSTDNHILKSLKLYFTM